MNFLPDNCTAWLKHAHDDPEGERGIIVDLEDGQMTVRLDTDCPCSCEDKIHVIATKTLNGVTEPTWDLTPYKYSGKYHKNARWRLVEGDSSTYGKGEIGRDGELIGLPDSFTTSYRYDGHMSIQEGCLNPDTGRITWPR